MKIAILGAANIAFQRFLPALEKFPSLEYAGVASRMPEKAKRFEDAFGGVTYPSYEAVLNDPAIEAVYLPLPPALHAMWGERALAAGKHVLMEKPFTSLLTDTKKLLGMAEERRLAIYENYMFLHHSQLAKIREFVSDGELGELRLYRISFGIPRRDSSDFRYQKALGGGALLDCGGYPLRLARELLGSSARVVQAELQTPAGEEVDIFGNAVVQNDDGMCAQISFGIDNAYQCRLEIWGSKGTLIAPRVFTAGAGVKPRIILQSSMDEKKFVLAEDDHFLHSIEAFFNLIGDPKHQKKQRDAILHQAELVDAVKQLACGKNN